MYDILYVIQRIKLKYLIVCSIRGRLFMILGINIVEIIKLNDMFLENLFIVNYIISFILHHQKNNPSLLFPNLNGHR